MAEIAIVISIVNGIFILVISCLLNVIAKSLKSQVEGEKQIWEVLKQILKILRKGGMI